MEKKPYVGVLLVVLCVLSCVGCKAGPAKPAGFVNAEVLEERADLPFHSAWVKTGVAWETYTEIYIEEVETDYLMRANWWKETFRYRKMEKDVKDIAKYAHKAFIKAYKEDPEKRFDVVSEPTNKTLVLEIAITELMPNKPFLKTLGYAPFGAGIGFKLINMTNPSVVAIEIRIRDWKTGEVLVMAADKEKEKVSFINRKHFRWYSHAKDIIDDWANQFVELANRRPGEIVKDQRTFELKPW